VTNKFLHVAKNITKYKCGKPETEIGLLIRGIVFKIWTGSVVRLEKPEPIPSLVF
jgi:hypothetical protein